MHITLQQLLTLDAVVRHGSFQSASKQLNKTHPSIISAMKKLEEELDFEIFDRSGYRTTLTAEGKSFYQKTKKVLCEVNELKNKATCLREGNETSLNIVIGDVTPLPKLLAKLGKFYNENPGIVINLHSGNISGPGEKLLSGQADLIFHHINNCDPRLEYEKFCDVEIIPVISKDVSDLSITNKIKYEDINQVPQCVIRCTASKITGESYFVCPNSPHINVEDQLTKKELILQGIAWGHMPLFMVKEELESGALVSIAGRYIKKNKLVIYMARLESDNKNTLAIKFWNFFNEN